MIIKYSYTQTLKRNKWFAFLLAFIILLAFPSLTFPQWTQTNLSGNVNVLFNHNNNILAGFNGNS